MAFPASLQSDVNQAYTTDRTSRCIFEEKQSALMHMLLRFQKLSAWFSTDCDSEHWVTSQWSQFPRHISTLNHFSNAVKEHEKLKEY